MKNQPIVFSGLACGKKFKYYPGGDWHVLRKIRSIKIDGELSNNIVLNATTDNGSLLSGYAKDEDLVIEV
jgi:hypothetical protein